MLWGEPKTLPILLRAAKTKRLFVEEMTLVSMDGKEEKHRGTTPTSLRAKAKAASLVCEVEKSPTTLTVARYSYQSCRLVTLGTLASERLFRRPTSYYLPAYLYVARGGRCVKLKLITQPSFYPSYQTTWL